MKEVSSVSASENRNEKNKVVGGMLYLVATPIGNMADITERAVKVLCEADFVAAEDTRNTGRLLSVIGSDRPMVSYYEHNKKVRGEVIAERLANGESCALVTDAGMPAVSDPGADLVSLCIERGIPVTCVPGACAAVDALALSGMNTERFAFEGFLSANKGERRSRLEEVRYDPRTLIFYEAPHKLKTTLADMLELFGDRRIALCRELTKINEEILRLSLSSACEFYENNAPRGEYVLVLEGSSQKAPQTAQWWSDLSEVEHVERHVASGMTKSDAIRRAAEERGISKNKLYKLVLGKD